MALIRKTVFATPVFGGSYDIFEYKITYEMSPGPNNSIRFFRHPKTQNIKKIRRLSYQETENWISKGIKPKVTATDID